MHGRLWQEQRGQVLIIVAIALTALLAFVALAIDVGNMYQVRRQMQNAADAGALAGARELCFGDPGQAEARAIEYARYNGAETVQVDFTNGGWTVDVTAGQNADMYIAPIIGVSNVDIAAEAAAACGDATSACGLWPVAVAKNDWDAFYAGDGCGKPFLIWSGTQEKDMPDCSIWDCNTEYGRMLDGQSRAWLDFTTVLDPEWPYPDTHCGKLGSGCGTDELKDCILSDTEARLVIPSCIPGDSGVKAGTQNAVEARIGDAVKVPLFTRRCSQSNCKEGYYAEALGCFQVMGWIQKVTMLPLPTAPPGTPKKWEDKAIQARMLCNDPRCVSECGTTSGSPPPPWGVRSVNLVK